MSLKIDLSQFEVDIKRYMAKQHLPDIMRKATILALPKIKQEFSRAYKRTDFSRGLRGKYAGDYDRDVMAILGFYPQDVDGIDEELAKILSNSIKFSPFITRNQAVYFQITSENLKDYLASEYKQGSYKTDTGATVDWLNWILYGGRVNANLVIGSFDESRSGRGIMLHVGKGSWSAAEYPDFPASSDGGFIQELLDSEDFKEKTGLILLEKIQKVLNV